MKTDQILQDEKIFASTRDHKFVFTNRRLIQSHSKDNKQTSILIESINAIELVKSKSRLLFILALAFISFSAFELVTKEYAIGIVSIFIAIAALLVRTLRSKQVVKVVLKNTTEIIIPAKAFDTDTKQLINKLDCARFERLNYLFKSTQRSQEQGDAKTIKISA